MKPATLRLTAIATTITTVMVSIHHIFRLGPELIVPAIIIVTLPIVLIVWLKKSGRRLALWLLATVNALIFVWFGLLDGILDHVLKALGADNVTILPGSDEHVVATVYALWSPEASNLFYEGTGLVQAAASVAMIALTVRLVVEYIRARRSTTARA